MYIEPNTTIKILKNCPLDNTYDHTIYMLSKESQEEYFSSLTKYTLSEQSYQRVNRGAMNVGIKADNLYDCNYLMFQNTSFGKKWFYAFITSVEYVNNVTARITFEIDVMQTWFFDYKLKECFVEREHIANDTIGANLIPENLELGEYVADDFTATGNGANEPLLAQTSIVVASTFDENYNKVIGGYYGGVYSGLHYQVFPNDNTGAEACSNFIKNAGSKADGIVAVFCMPTKFVVGASDPTKNYNFSKAKNLQDIGGYIPRNNKLFTYPFNFLYCTNLQGSGVAYPYEYFSQDKCTFTLSCDMSCNPSAVLTPTDYKGVTTNFDEKMVLSGFPQLSFTTDTFKAWLSQNATNLAVTALGGATASTNQYVNAQTMLNRGQGMSAQMGFQSASAGAILNVAGVCSQVYAHSLMPNQAHNGSGSQTMLALGLLEFAFMHKHITPEFARIIDDYFDMFGYATHRVKVPNRDSRPHWNYVKTANCVCTGSIPADDMRTICNIYNRGVTFWKHGSEVGNYSLYNK